MEEHKFHKRLYVGAAIIIALLSISYAAISFVHSYEAQIQPSSFRSFNVSAEGSVVAVPDVAQFSFTVISKGDTADLTSLQEENAKKIAAVTEFIKEKGVNDEDIKTTAYSVSPEYTSCYPNRELSGVCPPREIIGYTVQQSTQVKIRDFEIIGEALGGVVERGANSVSQLSFKIDDETAIESEAREEAIKKAEQKAKEIAKAGGFTVGKVLGIQEGNSYSYRTNYDYAYGASMDFAEESKFAPTIEAGSQDVTVSISITYEIK